MKTPSEAHEQTAAPLTLLKRSADPLAPGSRLSPALLIAGGLALLLVVVVVAGLWQLRSDAVSGQSRELSTLTRVQADALERSLQGVELALLGARLELQEGTLAVPSGAANDLAAATRQLNQRVALLPLAHSLVVLDGSGRPQAVSDHAAPELPVDFLPTLQALGQDQVAISRAYAATAKGDALRVGAALRRLPTEGSPRRDDTGWVLAEVSADALVGLFAQLAPAADARMAVYRRDGVLLGGSLARRPGEPEPDVQRWLSGSPAEGQQLLGDGTHRLLQAQPLARFPLVVVLTRKFDAAIDAWFDVARFAALGLTLALALLGTSAWRLQRAEQRRRQSQVALQNHLARTNKLESLGTLAGGVAHDFNNILAAVQGYSEMARSAAPPGSAQARQIDHVLQASARGQKLVARIMAFSRERRRARTVFPVRSVVEEVLELLNASLPPGVRVERALSTDDLRLEGDPTLVFEAVMNLCTNAVQALPGGGVVRVHLDREVVSHDSLSSHGPLRTGAYARITVSDTGPGMTPEVLERLFEPFFTTRGHHSGTGLGLAVVHGVAGDFHGTIDVQSQPGVGSRFTLYLGLSDRPLRPEAPVRRQVEEIHHGQGQTLLVIDDEPALMRLAEERLAEIGYEPVGFTDPVAALAALRADPTRFDLVITDEVMPGLCGTEFAAAAHALAPGLPVVMVTGYGGAQLEERAAAAGIDRLLSKPIQGGELAQVLAELLNDDLPRQTISPGQLTPAEPGGLTPSG